MAVDLTVVDEAFLADHGGYFYPGRSPFLYRVTGNPNRFITIGQKWNGAIVAQGDYGVDLWEVNSNKTLSRISRKVLFPADTASRRLETLRLVHGQDYFSATLHSRSLTRTTNFADVTRIQIVGDTIVQGPITKVTGLLISETLRVCSASGSNSTLKAIEVSNRVVYGYDIDVSSGSYTKYTMLSDLRHMDPQRVPEGSINFSQLNQAERVGGDTVLYVVYANQHADTSLINSFAELLYFSQATNSLRRRVYLDKSASVPSISVGGDTSLIPLDADTVIMTSQQPFPSGRSFSAALTPSAPSAGLTIIEIDGNVANGNNPSAGIIVSYYVEPFYSEPFVQKYGNTPREDLGDTYFSNSSLIQFDTFDGFLGDYQTRNILDHTPSSRSFSNNIHKGEIVSSSSEMQVVGTDRLVGRWLGGSIGLFVPRIKTIHYIWGGATGASRGIAKHEASELRVQRVE